MRKTCSAFAAIAVASACGNPGDPRAPRSDQAGVAVADGGAAPLPGACATPPVIAPDALADVRIIVGARFSSDQMTSNERDPLTSRARKGAPARLWALQDIVTHANDDTLGEMHPEALFDTLQFDANRIAHGVAQCVRATYAGALARAKAASKSAEIVKRLEASLHYVTGYATREIFCVNEPCLAGEICVHTCCSGPCTPAAPHCEPQANALAACGHPGLAHQTKGADTFCRCPEWK